MKKRELDVVILSDLHLGTYGCQSKELNKYISSINPKIIILNGDIFDGHMFNRKHFDKGQFEFLYNILSFIKHNKKVYYLVGNHDEFLREFEDIEINNFVKCDRLILDIGGKKHLIFHGDKFDVLVQGKSGLVLTHIGMFFFRLGLLIESIGNFIMKFFTKKKVSFTKNIREKIRQKIKKHNNFEQRTCEHAIEGGFDYVINGHIHEAKIMEYSSENGSVIYMNSGDFVENLSSLEFDGETWKVFKYYE